MFPFVLKILNFFQKINKKSYGKHWKKEKIDSVFGPSKKSIQIVKNFIKVCLFYLEIFGKKLKNKKYFFFF